MERTKSPYLYFFAAATALICGCGDSNTTTPVERRVEFVPGRYRAEIIKIDSDCEPPLEHIIAATGQPSAGIVELVWQDIFEPPLPVAEFTLVDPRLESMPTLKTTTYCEEIPGQSRLFCTFLPGEKINELDGAGFYLGCNQAGDPITGPEFKIFQGSSRGVFEVETVHPWTEPLVGSSACLPMETFPRTACTERFVTRYTLVRECPLNCTAKGSGYSERRIDIFRDIEGTYREVTRPEELYECVPFDSRRPLTGGECAEEFIVP